ncbi:MAG TPA: DinB family protein [Acidimicrobiales bacterium]|nr:DinB family protein [Acidimicrobiales bacterium]
MARADQYADALEAANEELISFADSCSEQQWRTLVPGENWSVGVLVHHCAVGHEVAASWLREMVESGVVAVTPEDLDATNASHAAQFADIDIAETVTLLRRNGESAASYLRTLTDEQLDREGEFGPAGGGMFRVDRFAGAFARHPLTHLGHARDALAEP